MKIWKFSLILGFCSFGSFLLSSFLPLVFFDVYPLFASILQVITFYFFSFLFSYFCCDCFNVSFRKELINEKK